MNISSVLLCLIFHLTAIDARYAGFKYCSRFRHLLRCVNIARVPDLPPNFSNGIRTLDLSGSRIRNLNSLEVLRHWRNLTSVILTHQKTAFDCTIHRQFPFDVITDCEGDTDSTLEYDLISTTASSVESTLLSDTSEPTAPFTSEIFSVKRSSSVRLTTVSQSTKHSTPVVETSHARTDATTATQIGKSVTKLIMSSITTARPKRQTRLPPYLKTVIQRYRRASTSSSGTPNVQPESSTAIISTEREPTNRQQIPTESQPKPEARHFFVAFIVAMAFLVVLIFIIGFLLHKFCVGCRKLTRDVFCVCCKRKSSSRRHKDKDSDGDSPTELGLYVRPPLRHKRRTAQQRSAASNRLPGIIDTLEAQATSGTQFEWEQWSDCEL